VANTQENALVARAVLRDIRHTPQKARRIVDLIRGQRADEALNILKFAPQAAGQDVYTLLNSAVANAKAKNPAIRDASELWVVGFLAFAFATAELRSVYTSCPAACGANFKMLSASSARCPRIRSTIRRAFCGVWRMSRSTARATNAFSCVLATSCLSIVALNVTTEGTCWSEFA